MRIVSWENIFLSTVLKLEIFRGERWPVRGWLTGAPSGHRQNAFSLNSFKSVSLAWLARLPLPRANSNASQLGGLRLRANSKTSHLSGLRSRANSKTSHLIGLHSQAARAASEPIFLKCRPLAVVRKSSFYICIHALIKMCIFFLADLVAF